MNITEKNTPYSNLFYFDRSDPKWKDIMTEYKSRMKSII